MLFSTFEAMENARIPFPPNFSFGECRWFLNRNFDDCLHIVDNHKIIKALRVNGALLAFELSANEGNIRIDIIQGESNLANQEYLKDYVANWFDMGRDLSPFYELLRKDAVLGYMADAYYGLRLVGIMDLFEALAWAIIGQQINLKFAYTLKRRLVEKYGEAIEINGRVLYVFPKPEIMQHISIEELRELQFSRSKAEYLITISKVFAAGEMSETILKKFNTHEEKIKQLTAIKGIGSWTANYALMKTFRAPEAIPHGDAGLLNALIAHKLIQDKKDQQSIFMLFQQFPGWESYLVFYLWRSLAEPDL